MVSLGLLVLPHVKGSIHIMANPVYAYSTEKVVENGQRKLFQSYSQNYRVDRG